MKTPQITIRAFGLLAALLSTATATALTGSINLSEVTADTIVADGATATLDGVAINGVNDEDCEWAGITCEGGATIVLKGANTVKGFFGNHPGIYVPQGKTGTIKGNGSLDAASTFEGAENAAVSVPVANVKTKTVTLPGGATMEMIYCPPGTFMMGRNVDAPNGGDAGVIQLQAGGGEVVPPIKVTLTKGFWLGKYEVTQAQYKSVMGENPSDSAAIGDNIPVNRVTWDDAAKFFTKVGSGARLPTDAEWEYACKAGTDTAFPWGDVCNGQETNCNGTRPFGTMSKGPNIGRPVKVGSYPQNPWGFHDMTGNVSELCSDKFNAYLSTMETRELVDPKGYPYTSQRTMRGGNYMYYPYGCRSVWRQSCPQNWPAPHIGFRMAMDE